MGDNINRSGLSRLAPATALAIADPELLNAWRQWKAAHRARKALLLSDGRPDADQIEAQEKAARAEVDAIEERIRAATANTPRGAAIQLWIALAHGSSTKRELCDAIELGFLAPLDANESELDWSDRLVLAAIRSLDGMRAAQ